jgi:hypothetical protein
MINIGTTVIIMPNAEYNNRFVKKVGVVKKVMRNHIGVLFDDITNTASSYGVFWFDEHNIEIIENEVQIMNANFIVAGIKFLDGTNTNKEYIYALYDESIYPGDIVVVKTGHHGLALAEVTSRDAFPKDSVKCGREIISRVDFTAYNEREAKAKHLSELKTAMDKKVEELQHTASYELLAEKDPTLKAMLEEYKSLIG